MRRDLDRLTACSFDVLVVGGGIYGLTIACDGAARGLTVALIERGDFGSGSSFNHLRTIHGGLRYLQSFNLSRARESVRERRTLARIAPHAVSVLPFALPLFPGLLTGKTAMRAGLFLDRLVAADRNAGVPAERHLPPGRVITRDEAIRRFPGLRRQGMTGAAVWHDYVTPESDRLTFAWATAAVRHGAVIANYVDAVAIVTETAPAGARVTGVRARDLRTGRAIEIGARVIVNATGPAIDKLLEPLGVATGTPLIKTMNLVTTREAGGEAALGGRTRAGKHLFLVPWRSRALFGTWESSVRTAHDDVGAREEEVAGFVTQLNDAFPSLDLTIGDVALVHRGVVPAIVGPEGALGLEGHEQVFDHASGPGGKKRISGLLSVAGTKYTTARGVAERVTDRLVAALGRRAEPCRTADTRLPGGDLEDVARAVSDARREHGNLLPSDTLPHLIAAYGSAYRDVVDLAATRPEWRTRLADQSPVVGAQLVWAVREEMAQTLADGVIRRTPLGALGYPGDAAVARAAAIVGDECGWDEDRRREEAGKVRDFYGTSKALNT